MQQNYYEMLEVSPSATLAEIKRSYHRLARQLHPDLNKQALDTHIKRLNLVYQTLRDPQKRAAYDEQLAEEQRQAAPTGGMAAHRYRRCCGSGRPT